MYLILSLSSISTNYLQPLWHLSLTTPYLLLAPLLEQCRYFHFLVCRLIAYYLCEDKIIGKYAIQPFSVFTGHIREQVLTIIKEAGCQRNKGKTFLLFSFGLFDLDLENCPCSLIVPMFVKWCSLTPLFSVTLFIPLSFGYSLCLGVS